jgi:type II secretory pathway pseudopilin PulG
MTLVEVMLAASVFVVAALGLYSVLIRAYQLGAYARYRDNARAILQTYADQFQLLWPVDSAGNPLEIFEPTDSGLQYGTGKGLRYWNSTATQPAAGLSDESSAAGGFANGPGPMTVTIGGANNSIDAQVYRQVVAVDPGAPDSTGAGGEAFTVVPPPVAKGGRQLLVATFTITYYPLGKTSPQVVQQLSVMRSFP